MVIPKVYRLGSGDFAVQIHGKYARLLGDPLVVMPLKKGEAFMSGFNEGGLEEATPEEIQALQLTSEHVNQVCRPGGSEDCCRYLFGAEQGCSCTKGSGNFDLVVDLNEQVSKGKMRATGHNCEGRIGETK